MKQKTTKKCENGVQLRPASIEEAGLFYSQVEEERDLHAGTVGHVRMDFGHGGREFWHTWWPHNEDRFNKMCIRDSFCIRPCRGCGLSSRWTQRSPRWIPSTT